MKIWSRSLLALLALTMLIALMGYQAGFFEGKIEPGRFASAPEPVQGQMAEVLLHRVSRVERAVGTLRPVEETEVASRILANVIEVKVQEGDSVRLGDVLVRLDHREIAARYEQSRQQQNAAQARLEEAQSGYQRIRDLSEQGLAAAVELDRVRAELKLAEAQLSRAQEAVEEVSTMLSYAMLKAPISGRVIHRRVDPGDTVVPGSPLVHLYNPNALRLEANVRESLAAQLSLGDRLQVRIDARNITIDASIEDLVPAADPGSRSFLVKAALPAMEGLYPGMYGQLLIPTGMEEHISVPAEAINRVGQLEYVMLVKGEQAIRRYIRVGAARHDKRIEILSGLSPGDWILIPREGTNAKDESSPG